MLGKCLENGGTCPVKIVQGKLSPDGKVLVYRKNTSCERNIELGYGENKFFAGDAEWRHIGKGTGGYSKFQVIDQHNIELEILAALNEANTVQGFRMGNIVREALNNEQIPSATINNRRAALIRHGYIQSLPERPSHYFITTAGRKVFGRCFYRRNKQQAA